MRLALLFLCLPLLADDPKPTVEQLQAQIVQLKADNAKLTQKLNFYQTASFRCQDAMLDKEIDQQVQKSQLSSPAKPEAK